MMAADVDVDVDVDADADVNVYATACNRSPIRDESPLAVRLLYTVESTTTPPPLAMMAANIGAEIVTATCYIFLLNIMVKMEESWPKILYAYNGAK